MSICHMTIKDAVWNCKNLSPRPGESSDEFWRRMLNSYALSQLEEAMGRVEGEIKVEDESRTEYIQGAVEMDKAWRAKIAAVLEEYKQGLV